MRFTHLADCHLGGWRFPELTKLNMESFRFAVNFTIQNKSDFMLVAGDLFNSAYPRIEIIKDTFEQFRKLKVAEIPVYLISGSHDYSAGGKTFLDLLESSGLCVNVGNHNVEEDISILLPPTFHKDIAIYGYPGKKSGLELKHMRRTYIEDNDKFKIFMIHSTITDVIGTLPIESIDSKYLPRADYYAFGHIHVKFEKVENGHTFVYPGPVFPNNFRELYLLRHGSFQSVEVDENSKITTTSIDIPTKEILFIDHTIENSSTVGTEIYDLFTDLDLEDKIIILRLSGNITRNQLSDIKFDEIRRHLKEKKALVFLHNTSQINIILEDCAEQTFMKKNFKEIEKETFNKFIKDNPTSFNKNHQALFSALLLEKEDKETKAKFADRLIKKVSEVLDIEDELK